MTPQEFFKYCYNRQFQNMIAYEQIDKDGNIIGIVPNYTGFFESEEKEYYTGTASYFQASLFNKCTKKAIIDIADALADMIVCLCGQVITKEITQTQGEKATGALLNQCMAMQKYLRNGFFFLDIQNEVFDTNFNRIQRDENGNIMKQPALLEDGEPNPEAGKIIRRKLNPNLEQFFK